MEALHDRPAFQDEDGHCGQNDSDEDDSREKTCIHTYFWKTEFMLWDVHGIVKDSG